MVYQLKRLQTNERPQAFWGSLIPSAISFIGGLITSSQQAKAQRRALEEQQRLAQQQLNISNQNQLASSLNNYANAQQSYDDKDYNLKYRIGGVKRLGGRNIMITDGGNAKRIGNNTYLLRGGSHEDINETGQTGIGINVGGNEIEAEGGEVAQRKGNSLRIYSAQPILGGMSPAQAIMRGYNKDKVFNAQQRFKKNNGIKDDGSKAQVGGYYGANYPSPLSLLSILYDKTLGRFDDKNPNLQTGIAPTPSRSLNLKQVRGGLVTKNMLPTNRVYRITNMREVKDAKAVGQYRALPDGVTLPSRKVTTRRGLTFDFGKAYGNSHGGKAASMGQPWTGTTSGGYNESRYVISTPSRHTVWRVGHHGNYSKPLPADAIKKGSGVWKKFDDEGNTGISTKRMTVYKELGNGRYLRLPKSKYRLGGGLTSKDRGSSKHPYPSVSSKDFAGGNRSYPIPTKADAIDALRLAGLHGRSDVRSKVYSKYPELRKKARGGTKVDPYYDWARNTSSNLRISFIDPTYDYRTYYNSVTPYERNLIRFAPQGTHFTDIGKTPKHPTFSNESIYSNKKHPGGTWNGNVFVPNIWQFGNNGNKVRNKYMNNSGEGYFNGRVNVFPKYRKKAENGTSVSLTSSYGNKDFLHRITQGHPTARKIVNEIFGDEADRRRLMQDLNMFGLTSDDASGIAAASPIFRQPIVSAARQAQFIQDANKARQAANANKARQAANYAQQQIDYIKELSDRMSATMRNVGEQLGIRVNPNPNNSVRILYSSNFKPTKTNNRITTPRETPMNPSNSSMENPINSTTSSATNTPTYSGKTTKFNTKYRSYRNAGFSPRTSKNLVKANKLDLYSTIGGFGTIGAGTLIGANINKTDKSNKAQLDAKGQPISPYIARPQEPAKPQAKKAAPARKDTTRTDTTKQVNKVVKRQIRTTPQYTGNTTKGNYQLHDGETKTINGVKYTRRGNTIINHKTNVGYIYDKNGNYTGQADYSKVGNFNQAFNAARAAGRSQFIYRAGKYQNYSTNKETDAKKEALNRRVGARRIYKRMGGLTNPPVGRRKYLPGGTANPWDEYKLPDYGGTAPWQVSNKYAVNVPYPIGKYDLPITTITTKKDTFNDEMSRRMRAGVQNLKDSSDTNTTIPYLGRQSSFKPQAQDYIGLGIDTLAALGSGMFTRSAYNKMNFDYALPNYVDESPVAFDTTYHNEAQRANVERNRLNTRGLITGNTSSAQTALNLMQKTDTDAMMETNKLLDEKSNKEVELRNQNLANEQQVRARNAAARNQYYQNVAQIRNAALEARNNIELAKAQSIGADLSGLSQAWTNFASTVENRYDTRQNEIAAISSANNPSVVKNAISLGYNLSPEVLANLYKNSKNDELRNTILGRLSPYERKRYGIK